MEEKTAEFSDNEAAGLKALLLEVQEKLCSRQWEPAIQLCDYVISNDPQNAEAFFLRCMAVHQCDQDSQLHCLVRDLLSDTDFSAALCYASPEFREYLNSIVHTQVPPTTFRSRLKKCNPVLLIIAAVIVISGFVLGTAVIFIYAEPQEDTAEKVSIVQQPPVRGTKAVGQKLSAEKKQRFAEEKCPAESPVKVRGYYQNRRKAVLKGINAYQSAFVAPDPFGNKGRAFPRTDTEMFIRCRREAERGYNVLAQYNLGVMYEQGRGVARNDAEAAGWYRKAAVRGCVPAQCNLGVMYEQGRGVAKDDAEAFRLYGQAASRGHAGAQCNLGRMYEQGRGVAKDDAEAFRWYRKSAEHGYAPAQCKLGWMYANGYGVRKDYAEAVKWYQRSAEQGNSVAAKALVQLQNP